MIHVVEAKGGTSLLGKGYGHPQGTSEWAVEAAKSTLNNHAATETEKKVAKEVLEAAKANSMSTSFAQHMYWARRKCQQWNPC
jgi:hypothetical protein